MTSQNELVEGMDLYTCDDVSTLRSIIQNQEATIKRLNDRIEKYEAIFQGFSDAIVLIDDKVTECNKNACHLWKCGVDDIIGFFPSDFAPLTQPCGDSSFSLAQQKINEAFKGNIQKFEWKDIRRDGIHIDTEVTLNNIQVSGKQYVLATFRDITDAKTKENEKQALLHMMERIIEDRTKSLQEYNASLNEEIARRLRIEKDLEHAYLELKQIFNTSGDGILVIDTDRNIVRANKAFLELVEKDMDEVTGSKCFNIFPCRQKCTDHCIIQEIVLGTQQTDFEKEFVSESGECKSCLVKAAVLRNSTGEVLGIVKNYKDLTNYRRWVDMLKDSEEFHRITLASISDAIFLTDDAGSFIFISCNVINIFGYDKDEVPIRFKTIFELVGCGFYSPQQLHKAHEINNIEVEITDKSHKKHVLIANIKKAYIRSATTLIAFRDITERKDAEEKAKIEYEQLVQAGKMVTLGILVSGVAHEINNPNNSIMLNIPLLSRLWGDAKTILDQYMAENGDFMIGNLRYSYVRERVPELFSGISTSSKRIKRIVQDLKNYARQGSSVLNEIIDINGVLQAAVVLLDNLIRKTTDNLQIRYGLGLPHFQGNFQKVEQVIINLIQNACESLNNKGQQISIVTGFDKENTRIWLRITDQGKGILPEDLPHIIDPFFTTKRSSGGTGLGLSISSRIMNEHGGDMVFQSQPGVGTTVTLTFPA